MQMKSIQLESKLYEFFLNFGVREHPELAQLCQQAEQHPQVQMLSTVDSAQLLYMLVKLTQAKNVLEIGCFLGYSALAMALALPDDGKVITCELSEDFATQAKQYWQQAGQLDKIDCRIAPAIETLAQLSNQQFDLIFIDADKANYVNYYQQSLALLKSGGLMIIDNMLMRGRVVDETDNSKSIQGIRELNALIQEDQRVDMLMLTVGDGMTLAIKR